MNLLFVTNNLYPYLNANSEIAYKLAAVMKKEYGCSVTVLGYSDKERPLNHNPYMVNEYEMKAIGIGRRIMAKRENRIIKILRLICHPCAFRYVFSSEKNPLYILKSQYSIAIRKLCRKQKFDCIVCFKNPNDALAGAINAKTDLPIVAYELDPWENAEGQIDDYVREQQYSLEKHCAAIITTMLLYPTYFEEDSRIPTERVFCAEFPNIVKHVPKKNISFSDGKIHCVFTGQLYDDIRNPQYTIDLFSKLASEDIVLDIFGNDNGCLKGVRLPENVVYHGEVISEDAMAYLFAADVVLNIGNTLTNQMPSKILTCISLGKPILNIIKTKDCPTLNYMERYPIALSLLEKSLVTDEEINNIMSFCKQARGQLVEFNTIKEMYCEATPEYVGGKLIKVIKDITKKE